MHTTDLKKSPALTCNSRPWLQQPLPAALWQTLRTRGLPHPDAPVPA
ncbi:MAG: hypothetical protein ABI893_00535 [Polaromonas sp.]